ncbi:MAG: hypothetical protein ABIC91_03705 [Nanoarchaeota archaeon]|nr:hypothetical protein [Nanoarchaeota archaeon]MBU1031158.1 hypothetical protein [Nanoarchaeota archaeon]MBU1850414.1 hypothetical protein [Nanoarchaeota archaeon]
MSNLVSVIKGTRYLSIGAKGTIPDYLTKIAKSHNTETFQKLYQQIERAFQSYKEIEPTFVKIKTKNMTADKIEDLEILKPEKLMVGSRIQFQTKDNNIEGLLFIGHLGDILPELKYGPYLEVQPVEGHKDEYVKKFAEPMLRLGLGTIATSIVKNATKKAIFSGLIITDQVRRTYNSMNAKAHHTLRLTIHDERTIFDKEYQTVLAKLRVYLK